MRFVYSLVVSIVLFALASCATTPKGPIEDRIVVIFPNHVGESNYPEFKAMLADAYKKEKRGSANHKTVAIAFDVGGIFVISIGYGGVSPGAADHFAQKRCAELREENSVKAECEFFSKNERVVLDRYE